MLETLWSILSKLPARGVGYLIRNDFYEQQRGKSYIHLSLRKTGNKWFKNDEDKEVMDMQFHLLLNEFEVFEQTQPSSFYRLTETMKKSRFTILHAVVEFSLTIANYVGTGLIFIHFSFTKERVPWILEFIHICIFVYIYMHIESHRIYQKPYPSVDIPPLSYVSIMLTQEFWGTPMT